MICPLFFYIIAVIFHNFIGGYGPGGFGTGTGGPGWFSEDS